MFTGDYGFFDYKYNISDYNGKDFGGPAQTVYLAASGLLLILALLLLRRVPRERVRRIVGLTGVFLTLFYLGKTAWESWYDIQREGSFNLGLLPLDTCSVIMPAALLAGFGRGRVRRAAVCWLETGGVVGGIGAMVKLNAFRYYPFWSFGAFYSMLWHLLMVCLGALCAVTDLEDQGRRTVRYGFLFHLPISALVILADFCFGFDFMLYRDLGGVPFFEGVAQRLTEAGLRFLNPLLMLVLYYLAFWVAYGITRGLRLVFRPRSRPA